MKTELDKKDYKILGILNRNFRVSFSEIAKKVGLSKNSVRLRFQKLTKFMVHNTTGLNNKILGYTLVKFFYSLDYLDEDFENIIVGELTKHPKVVYAARHYGHYNLEIAIMIKDFDELNEQIKNFNDKFSKRINKKEIEIVTEENFFGDEFLCLNKNKSSNKILNTKTRYNLTKKDKEILYLLRQNPRISIVDISKNTSLNLKTVIKQIKFMEKSGIIVGYFMTLNYSKFNMNRFKFLVQLADVVDEIKFEEYLSHMKNVKHFSKMLGLWDYEIDVVYQNILELHSQIELFKKSFPKQIKQIELLSHGKRIFTNQENFFN